ncbi:MAG TPA: alpha/beta hydrolase [Hydrogenophaga sp.]|jgi:pimeloyl-ACP methyl ester carboxylesterase|uniref:alpha/beta fold hydrolase n=1 Tax=Hydrogenophaga sp. TaxID=1904254 RepID=UPI0008BB16F9|nr:alpha/beta hydrolase [Hydrogenophaga sp.]OGA74645.1 MAG: alpha/beta hydrolase [Burkholderiales bacterium GWE1_65_30]OGA94034.1 MAG: alpha/beta hydrolase [Burkholderiales bacterium GWF1_66_17]OGB23857.1 MAG: alpha/beta hydrolase [Burkholderiales bacterium RIFCSPHIGHO2_02_FULL_66_10]OGB31542.1 MAG: alpha/beta hydrolase [Burkholderiales bacterium RIFCSPLOWO2_02_FULL_66_35]HAX20388.1 alpha/beta hydrolase [Hydrogenophaga sp.]
MSLIVFSHANSFPASTYGVLFKSLRARGFSVRAPEKFGHDPAYPVSSNWPHLVQQLADFAAPEIERHGQPAWLVGHSLGGFLSLMCAARHPALGGHGVKGVLLLDSPVLGGWRARALELAKRTQLVGSISPGKISRKRRNAWPDAQAAFDHFAHKKAFARWEPQVLRDYIAHATHDETTEQGMRRVLGFERDVETAIYNTLPHNLDRLLRRHPLPCPVAFIGGTESLEMKQVGMAMTHRLVGRDHPERLLMVEGSHLFPMEKPQETAATIDAVLRSLGA